MAALALEVEHRVHHVLEDARAGDGAVLGHVTHEKGADAALLGQGNQRARALPDLPDAPRSGRDGGSVNGLDGIHHQHRGLDGPDLFEDALQRRLAQHQQVRRRQGNALSPHLDLLLRLLAGDVKAGRAVVAEGRHCLKQQRRLADARVAADEHRGPIHQAAPQHPVELFDA